MLKLITWPFRALKNYLKRKLKDLKNWLSRKRQRIAYFFEVKHQKDTIYILLIINIFIIGISIFMWRDCLAYEQSIKCNI